MIDKTKHVFRNIIIILCFSSLGIITGNVMANNQLVAFHPCQDDECEDGWFGDYCKDNPGGGTYCNFVGEDCFTRSCGHLEEA